MYRFIFFVISTLFVSCGPAIDVRQGEVGEFCNSRDTDCRPGLVCASGVCEAVSDPGFGCDAICSKLQTCGTRVATCETDCRITISGWSAQATEQFSSCLTDDLTCEEVVEEFAPQTCYDRLPIPELREDVCRTYVSTLRACSDDASTLRAQCYRAGRTYDDSRWSSVAACEDFGDATCEALANCVRNTTRD